MKEITQYPTDELENCITDREVVRYFWDINDENFCKYLNDFHNISFKVSNTRKINEDAEVIELLKEHNNLKKYWEKYGNDYKKKVGKYYIYKDLLYYVSGIPGYEPTILRLDYSDIVTIFNSINIGKKITRKIFVIVFLLLFLFVLAFPIFFFDIFNTYGILYIGITIICTIPLFYLIEKFKNYYVLKLDKNEAKNLLDLLSKD